MIFSTIMYKISFVTLDCRFIKKKNKKDAMETVDSEENVVNSQF